MANKFRTNSLVLTNQTVTATGSLTYVNGLSYPFYKSVTIENPTLGDNISLFYINRPLNVTEVDTVVSGDATASITYSIKYATGRNQIGTELNVGGILSSNQNTGDRQFSFNNSMISGNTYSWLYINSTGGNPKQFHMTMYLNYI